MIMSVHVCAIMSVLHEDVVGCVNLNLNNFCYKKNRKAAYYLKNYHSPILFTYSRQGSKQYHTFMENLIYYLQMIIAHYLGRPETVPIEARSCGHLQRPIWESLS